MSAQEQCNVNSIDNLFRDASFSLNAVKNFTKAINACPSNVALHCQRCIAFINLVNYENALEDATTCVTLDPKYTNGYLLKAVCEIKLQQYFMASQTFQSVHQSDTTDEILKYLIDMPHKSILRIVNFTYCLSNRDFETAMIISEQLLQETQNCVLFVLMKVAVLNRMQLKYRAAQISSLIKPQLKNVNHFDLNLRGMCLYYLGEVEKAIPYFTFASLIAPDSKHFELLHNISVSVTTKKELAKEAINNGQYGLAMRHYSSAIVEDETNDWGNAKLYFNRSVVSGKMNFIMSSVHDCTKAIHLNRHYVKAYLRRAQLYYTLKIYKDSAKDYETVYLLEPCKEYLSLWKEAASKATECSAIS